MTRQILRAAQFSVLINLVFQFIWVTHINYPNFIPFTFSEVKLLIISVPVINLISAIFIGVYLLKKGYKSFFYGSILDALYYFFLLIMWYLLVTTSTKRELV